MHSRDSLFQEDDSSEHTHSITWSILLQRLRDRRMYDVAQDIESLFNNKAALVHVSRQGKYQKRAFKNTIQVPWVLRGAQEGLFGCTTLPLCVT